MKSLKFGFIFTTLALFSACANHSESPTSNSDVASAAVNCRQLVTQIQSMNGASAQSLVEKLLQAQSLTASAMTCLDQNLSLQCSSLGCSITERSSL